MHIIRQLANCWVSEIISWTNVLHCCLSLANREHSAAVPLDQSLTSSVYLCLDLPLFFLPSTQLSGVAHSYLKYNLEGVWEPYRYLPLRPPPSEFVLWANVSVANQWNHQVVMLSFIRYTPSPDCLSSARDCESAYDVVSGIVSMWNLNKKLSYLQRKRTSNMAILYGAKGISIWNRLGMEHVHECASTVAPSAESIRNKFETCRASGSLDSFRSVYNTLVRGETLNSRPRNLASRNQNDRSIVRCQHIYIRLFRFVRVHEFDGRTDTQTDRCRQH